MKHTLSLFSTLFFALCLALLAPAQAAETAIRSTLSNGMTLIVQPDHRAPTAVHMVWVRVGSYDEVDGTSGVAHVLEHMMFKGSRLLKAGEFSRRVAALGGRENAFTSTDNTGYFQQIPANRLEDVMKLEADRFGGNRWPDAEFNKEIEVVKEERRMRTEDEPRAKLFETLNATAFMASPYRRPIIGWMSDLDAMKPNDVRAFHQRWYTPANAAVVVVGDVNPARVKAWAEKYYGRIPARAVPARAIAAEPAQAGIKRVQIKAPADQAYVALVYKVPTLRNVTQPTAEDNDAIALTVLAAVLDGYSGARLDRALTQGADRVADSAGAGNGLTGRGPQTFVLDGVPAPGKTAAQVEAALREQVGAIAREGVSEAELNRVKTQWVAAEVYKRDSLFNAARELGSQWVLGLPPEFDEQLLARLRAVTPQQVQDVAARYFGEDQLTVGELLPQPRDPKQPRRAAPAGDLR